MLVRLCSRACRPNSIRFAPAMLAHVFVTNLVNMCSPGLSFSLKIALVLVCVVHAFSMANCIKSYLSLSVLPCFRGRQLRIAALAVDASIYFGSASSVVKRGWCGQYGRWYCCRSLRLVAMLQPTLPIESFSSAVRRASSIGLRGCPHFCEARRGRTRHSVRWIESVMMCCVRIYLFLDLVGLFVQAIVLGASILGGLVIGGMTVVISGCPATSLVFSFRGD